MYFLLSIHHILFFVLLERNPITSIKTRRFHIVASLWSFLLERDVDPQGFKNLGTV